jgi:hypothetical protein
MVNTGYIKVDKEVTPMNFQTGKFKLSGADIDHRDLSTCRRMRGATRLQMHKIWGLIGQQCLINSVEVSDAAIKNAMKTK